MLQWCRMHFEMVACRRCDVLAKASANLDGNDSTRWPFREPKKAKGVDASYLLLVLLLLLPGVKRMLETFRGV